MGVWEQDLASRPYLPKRSWSQALALFALITTLRDCARAVALDVVGIDLPGGSGNSPEFDGETSDGTIFLENMDSQQTQSDSENEISNGVFEGFTSVSSTL